MLLNSIQSGAQLCQVKLSDNKPIATETKNQFAESFKAARNCINTISSRHGSSAKIVNKGDVEQVTKHLTKLLSEKDKKCNDEISQKANVINKTKISLEKNESFAKKLNSVTATNVRLKSEEFKPCYHGLTHLRKSIFSASYKDSLQNTKKTFKTLDKEKISIILENNIRKGNVEINKLDKEIATKRNALENIRTDLNKVKENTSILTEIAGKMSKKEVNDVDKATGAGNAKGRILNDKEKAAFFSIYSTNYGCKEINSALSANRELAIDTGKVTKEIQRRCGDDIFGRGAVREKEAINSIGKIKLKELKQVLENMYGEAINSKAARKTKTLYRGQNVDNNIINKIKNEYEENKLFNPGYLMSTSKSPEVASEFTKGDASTLFITVKGISGISVYSSHTVEKEEEYLFTPQSKFEIENFAFKNNRYEMTLVEKRPDEYKDRASVTFPRY